MSIFTDAVSKPICWTLISSNTIDKRQCPICLSWCSNFRIKEKAKELDAVTPNMQTCIQNLSHWCGWELSFLFWAYLYNFPFVIWLETQKMHASRQGWSCNPLVCQSTFNPWAIEEVGNIIVHSGSYCTVLYHNKRPKKVSHKADLIWQPLNPQMCN